MPAAPAQKYNQQTNLMARQLVLQNAVDEWQNIFPGTFTTGPGTVINVPLRNVGLIKRLIVEVQAQVQTSGGAVQTLTTLGASNFFSQVVLTDLSNQTRINTSGWHLTAVASAKARLPFGSVVTATDTPFGYGNNFPKVQTAPAILAAPSTAQNVFLMFEIPLSYSDTDLRGAIYANVVNATMNLQLTVNPNMFALSGATDATLAMYKSSSATVAGTLPTFTINVYQNYLDQLPIGSNGPVLPLFDLSTVYLLNNTPVSALVQNQDIPIPYANFRDFMSTTLIYDNSGVLSNGSDVTYFAIQSANYTNIIKADPYLIAFWSRLRLQSDFPTGMYYFDHRLKPISTVQYGNMALVVNLSSVTNAATAQFLVGYESLALVNQITQAGTLYGN